MDSQTFFVLAIVVAAILYVGRSLWPTPNVQSGCSACPQNRGQVRDYV
ncbi:MAG: hypothetical protein AB7G75_33525 [Candidatus Binatia bacterium]